MSGAYIPLYRKYRPQNFSEVVGQEAIVKALSNAITMDKVTHAYLLTGPRGTGKTSMARILAKSLNCENGGPTTEPCGKCASCLNITSGNAIDVIEIDAASNRSVEDARDLLDKVQYAPVSGKFKVYIIDEVHMLTPQAFNTLLKTLEEPPKNLVFILATTEAHKVLETIISRCQRFDFRRIKQDKIVERLKEINKLENLNITDKALSIIAKRAMGGLRDALALLDQASVLASLNKEVSENDILTLLGSLSDDVLFEITELILNKQSSELLKLIDDTVQRGNEPLQIIRELVGYFRNLMVVKTACNFDDIKAMTNFSEDMYKDIKKQTDGFEVLEITQIIEKLAEYERTLKATSQQYLWLEVGLISICNRNDIQVIKDLENRVEKLETAISTGKFEIESVPTAKSMSPSPVAKPTIKQAESKIQKVENINKADKVEKSKVQAKLQPLDNTPKVETDKTEEKTVSEPTVSQNSGDLKASWTTLLGFIKSVPSRMFFLNLSKPFIISENRVEIVFNNDNFVKQAQDVTKYNPLEEACKTMFGAVPKIVIRTPQPQDKQVLDTVKKIEKSEIKPANENIQSAKSSNTNPVKQNADNKKQSSTIVKDTEEQKQVNYSEAVNTSTISSSMNMDLSDTAKMSIDLFQGKVIE